MKLAYGLGSTAEAFVFTTTTTFLLLFYNQVRGLPAAKVGLVLSLGLIVNAVFDPMIGSWSDRTRSRWGRRHPFMFAAVIPAALCFLAIFNPPAALSQTGELIWLGVVNTLLLQVMTVYHTPHLALGGEMSTDYLERTSIMGFNTFCLWLGDTMGWLLSFRYFFRASPQHANGALDPVRWLPFAASGALLIAALFAFSSWSTLGRAAYLPQPAPGAQRFSVANLLRDVGRTLRNRNYLVLLFGLAFASLMSGVRIALAVYVNSYFWQLTNDQISLFTIASFAGYLFAAFMVKRLHHRFDKRWTGVAALLVYCVGPVIPLALGYVGVIGPHTPGLLALLIGFALLQHFPYSIMTTTIYSALADIADENELRFGDRQEGIFYATRTFFARVDQALGTAVAGWVLALIAFPSGATPGHVAQPVLLHLAGAMLLSTLPGIIAAGFYAMMRVTRETHDATRAAIAARREEAALSGVPGEAAL